MNCAAYTAVDKAESEPEKCELLNDIAPGYLAEAIASRGGSMIQISTDYVFDGKGHIPYREDMPTAPQSVYGRTKLAGEEKVVRNCPGAMVIRTAWLYSSYGKNFVKTMLRLAKERDEIGVVADQIGTPTYAHDLARAICTIVEQGIVPGIYHFTNEGVCSWYDFTKPSSASKTSVPTTAVSARSAPTSTPALRHGRITPCSTKAKSKNLRTRHPLVGGRPEILHQETVICLATHKIHERNRTQANLCHHLTPRRRKTTLTEKLLLFGGQIQVAGAVKNNKIKKTATSDWMEIEKQRGISVTTSVMEFDYDGYKVNILDTPGHQDFAEDTFRTLTAVDSAIIVVDSAKGVEAQTRKLMTVCRMRKTPVIIFINKMDREGKGPFDLLDELEQELQISVRPLSWPINQGQRFKGVYNIYEQKLDLFAPDKQKVTEKSKSTSTVTHSKPTWDRTTPPSCAKTWSSFPESTRNSTSTIISQPMWLPYSSAQPSTISVLKSYSTASSRLHPHRVPRKPKNVS